MKITKLLMLAALMCSAVSSQAINPKYEFRGAWMHIIGQDQYARQTTEQNKAYLIDQLDQLKAAGCNAVIWQIRPQADAAYPSEIEPWSRYISGKAGVAPSPLWDPMQFMIEECHKRSMEFHAWINPYRVKTSLKNELSPIHIYNSHPEWFVTYGDQLYFDPALPKAAIISVR
jgi:uncharacterized lipoprotein YddW (UPF0748 family)